MDRDFVKLQSQYKLYECPTVDTLVWDENDLVDVTSGVRVHEDGSVSQRNVVSAYPFDRAIGLRSGDTHWAVAYSNRQTKGILLKNGHVHRELNRSFYFAHVYDYPIALAHGPQGNVLLIHCPEDFDILEVQDAETGATLAKKKVREMEFHSRLAISPDSKYFLDAGWFWHPVGGAWLCEITKLLDADNSEALGHSFLSGAEVEGAAFLDQDYVVVTSTEEVIDSNRLSDGLGPRQLGLWSIPSSSWRSRVNLDNSTGTIMPWRDWVISFYEFPKAIEIRTGKIVYSWNQIDSGKQVGAIDCGSPPPPPMAFDPLGGRFAVVVPDGVAVVTLSAIARD